MTILAIAAEAMELRPWLKRLRAVRTLDWPVSHAYGAEWRGHQLVAVANGAGRKLAERAVEAAVSRMERVDAVLSTGLCGALDPSVAVSTVCTASAVGDGRDVWPAVAMQDAHPLRLLCADRFLNEAGEKEEWFRNGFGMVDMEAGSPASWAQRHEVPFYALKAVSDTAEESFRLDFNRYRDADGRFDRRRIAGAALLHPIQYMPSVLRMARRGSAGSEILGEFLANYQF